MRTFLLSTVAVVVTAAALSNVSRPAHAEVADTAAIVQLVVRTIQGFTQVSNYLKGQVSALQQTTDASNVANFAVQKELRGVVVRDEHVATPSACEALDNGQAIAVAAGQSWIVSNSISRVSDPRGEAAPNMPAYVGQANAQAANTAIHLGRYCGEGEAQDGMCTLGSRPNWDQRASTMLGALAYGDTPEDLTAANDYVTNLIQPVPPRALRTDEVRSLAGQDKQAWRRRYNAMISLARTAMNDIVAARTNTVTLTPAQREQQRAQGMTQTAKGSWMLAAELEVNRYVSGRAWARDLQRMPPAARQIEQIKLDAFRAYIDWQQFKASQTQTALLSAILADRAEAPFGRPQQALLGLATMPVPTTR